MNFEGELKEPDLAQSNNDTGFKPESVLENVEINDHNQEQEDQEQEDIEKMETALSEYCAQHGNPIKIWKSGSKIEKEPQLNSSLLTKNISQQIKDTLQLTLVKMVNFIHSPIFTDTFHKDHDARRKWEKETILTDENLAKYYQRNRLNVTNWSVFRSLDELLQENLKELPENVVRKVNNLIIATGTQFSGMEKPLIPDEYTYNKKLSDEEKVALMPEIERVTKTLIKLISE